MAGLMNVPRETRYQILELCLFVEGTINPYPAPHEDKDQFAKCNRKPDIALLKVNKVLNSQATDIFYKENTWQLSSPQPLEHPPFENDTIWKFHSHRISHLLIVMNMNDLPPNTVLLAAINADHRSLKDNERRDFIHESAFEAAGETWEWKMRIMDHIKPLTLEIDMRPVYCPVGCCRGVFIGLFATISRDLLNASNKGRHDELSKTGSLTDALTTDMSIVGLTNEEERYFIASVKGQESASAADNEPIDAPVRFRIEWRGILRDPAQRSPAFTVDFEVEFEVGFHIE